MYVSYNLYHNLYNLTIALLYSQAMLKSGSGLLSSSQMSSWRRMSAATRSESATALIVSLEQTAMEVAATIDLGDTVSSPEENIGKT